MIIHTYDAVIIKKYNDDLLNQIQVMINKIQSAVNNIMPDELKEIVDQIHDVNSYIFHNIYDPIGGVQDKTFEIEDRFLPYICRSILLQRKIVSNACELPFQRSNNPQLNEKINGLINDVEKYMKLDWFKKTKPIKIPPLIDYLTIEYINDLEKNIEMTKRSYDEKFRILLSPNLFVIDLKYLREKCNERNCGILVAYMDIDEFKKFNTKYTESHIDKHLLPRFMRVIDSHLCFHGHAYRIGGDEYIVTIPNITIEYGLKFFEELQNKLATTQNFNIDEKPLYR